METPKFQVGQMVATKRLYEVPRMGKVKRILFGCYHIDFYDGDDGYYLPNELEAYGPQGKIGEE